LTANNQLSYALHLWRMSVIILHHRSTKKNKLFMTSYAIQNSMFRSRWRHYSAICAFLADRTATHCDRLLASSCRPSARLSVTLCIVALRVCIQG